MTIGGHTSEARAYESGSLLYTRTLLVPHDLSLDRSCLSVVRHVGYGIPNANAHCSTIGRLAYSETAILRCLEDAARTSEFPLKEHVQHSIRCL